MFYLSVLFEYLDYSPDHLNVKPCLHQPCDKYLLVNSYYLNRKSIADRSQRLNTIRRDRMIAIRCSYDRRTTGLWALRNRRIVDREFAWQPYDFAKLSCDGRMTGTNWCGCRMTAVRLPYDCRTLFVRLSYKLADCFFVHVFFKC